MKSAQEYLQQAEQCEQEAAEAQLESSRKALLATATVWRKLADIQMLPKPLAGTPSQASDVSALQAKS